MLRFLADENFNGRILRGLLRRVPELDIVRAQDVEVLYGEEDPVVLAWAADEGRVVLTQDVATMAGFAYERVVAGEPMPGGLRGRSGHADRAGGGGVGADRSG